LSGWLDGVVVLVGCQTVDKMVMSSAVALSGSNSRQVSHTHVPLLPSSINWYWQRLGGKQAHYPIHWPRVRGLTASAGIWLRALNQRSVPCQRAIVPWMTFSFTFS